MTPCCFCNCITDVKPRSFNHRDIYQQVQITRRPCNKFTSESIAPDGFPPSFLRRRGWELSASTPRNYQISEAHGLDPSLRAHHPKFDFPINSKCSNATVVGKWYCPFMFIKEMSSLEEQMKKSMFYEMYLEQFWEEIYAHENLGNEGNAVVVKACVPKEAITLFGEEPVGEGTLVENEMMWFRPVDHERKDTKVGLSLAIVERMRWEAGRGGWEGGEEREVTVERVEEFRGGSGWRKFGCYVLVERFVLKRIDGSLVMCYDFKHTHKVITKWE
eukprot:TRINITY_DN10144_c0_g3_i2.p1 TRINITY_DN10144_c0_g3~~TRINITY_DN10144_c0_g3_i2.p1  ORF type:complete len:274 (+),score=62.69 TRINITY_DN10144_c0_g3_i2:355-1176(+)